jgi:hypothetical protein
LTGYESVGYIVLNVIATYEDLTESRKEFEVLSYKKNNNITELLVKTDDGEKKYVFMHEEYVLITKDQNGTILWEGSIIF